MLHFTPFIDNDIINIDLTQFALNACLGNGFANFAGRSATEYDCTKSIGNG